MSKFVEVAKTSELEDQSAICVEVEGQEIAIFNLGEEYYAIENACTHMGGPLAEGEISGDQVECPWHCARFSITSGEVLEEPAEESVAKYNVRVRGDILEIEI